MIQLEKKILYVDDEVENLTSFKYLFKKDFQVILASSAKEAIEILEEEKNSIPIIISDQRMPGMTGSELLKQISFSHPDSIRILLTGYSDLDSIIFAINNCQIFRFLSKPFQYEDLKNSLLAGFDLYFSRMVEKQKIQDVSRGLKILQDMVFEMRKLVTDWDQIANHLQLSLIQVSEQNIVLRGNPQFFIDTDWTPEEIMNRKVSELLEMETSTETHQNALGMGRLISKRGERIPVYFTDLRFLDLADLSYLVFLKKSEFSD